jgi:alpha-L-rhamnosidase
MKITKMKTNHLVNPLGYAFDPPFVSWVAGETTAKKQSAAQVTVKKGVSAEEGVLVFDSGRIQDISGLGYELPIKPEPYTRYFWKVSVWADNGDHAESDWAFFETAKLHSPWTAQWIRADLGKDIHPCLRKTFLAPGAVQWARAYVCGLGLYELEINGHKAGDEYLIPGYHAYDSFVQYQTYDVTALLREGANTIGAMLAPGWYKGRFVFEGGFTNIYGDTMELICELRIKLQDGRELTINSGADWEGRPSPIKVSSIYDGEEYDAAGAFPRWSCPQEEDGEEGWRPVVLTGRGVSDLRERINPPLRIHEQFQAEKLIVTGTGEQVLDFGQEITGWVSFRLRENKFNKPGAVIRLSYSEIMQDGKFYRDNLRSARAEYSYICDGKEALVRPHFTFFGFRYVKVEGIPGLDIADFTANAIYSDIERTGWIETSNPDLNRLISNILWAQKDNFLDIPTDCPQRDERMGWTGDVAVFCETAHQNMYTPAFFNHFMENIRAEQEKQDGAVPLFVPVPKPKDLEEGELFFLSGKIQGISVWGDAGSILPWSLYVMYGSGPLLKRHYGVIKNWAEYIIAQDNASGGSGLWKSGMHLGDWLSLDKEDTQDPRGSTDVYFIASAFYFNTLQIAAKAAGVLNLGEDQKRYQTQAEKIRHAFIAAYFNDDGTLNTNETQTALVVALHFGLFPQGAGEKLLAALTARIRARDTHLDTGFVGTPYLCPVLSKYGAGDLA